MLAVYEGRKKRTEIKVDFEICDTVCSKLSWSVKLLRMRVSELDVIVC